MDTFDCIVMGAAGRDFHDFLAFLRAHPTFRVRAFTATQIPFIADRAFPRALAGPGYDADIPIRPEEELPRLVRELGASFVFLSFSDLAHEDVMHRASLVQAAGASFVLLGPSQTQLLSRLPVVAVTAVRTGAGKSPLSQMLAADLRTAGRRVGVLRHPMPYGDLAAQSVQRFARLDDLERHACTVEEREEYTPYLEQGLPLFAGVDYARVLAAAEGESDVILWDGGNNDSAFVRPGLSIVVADALRPGHEVRYYPGETNFRSADVVVINKVGSAAPGAVEEIRANAAALCPQATVILGDLELHIDGVERARGRRALVLEDGPTLTHGGMDHGAGLVAARRLGCEVVDPRPHAVGTIAAAFAAFPHIGPVLPALGYSETQREELARTILATGAEVIVDASPARVAPLLGLETPVARVTYRFAQVEGPDLRALVREYAAGR